MQEESDIRPLVEGAMLAGIAVILLLSVLYLPVAGLAALLVWPVPITVLGVRHGTRYALLALATAALIAATLTNPLAVGVLVLWLGGMGIILGYGFRRRLRPTYNLALGTLSVLVSVLALFLIALLVFGVHPVASLEGLLERSGSMVLDFTRDLGVRGARMAALGEALDQARAGIGLLLPAALVLSSSLCAFIGFTVSRLVLGRLGQPVPGLPPLSRWRFPAHLLAGYLLGLLFWLGGDYLGWPVVREIGLNVRLVFLLALVLAGGIVIYDMMERRRLHWLWRGTALVLVLLQPLLLQLVAVLGMADILFNLRRR